MNITYFDSAETFVCTKISDGLTIENNLTPWLKKTMTAFFFEVQESLVHFQIH